MSGDPAAAPFPPSVKQTTIPPADRRPAVDGRGRATASAGARRRRVSRRRTASWPSGTPGIGTTARANDCGPASPRCGTRARQWFLENDGQSRQWTSFPKQRRARQASQAQRCRLAIRRVARFVRERSVNVDEKGTMGWSALNSTLPLRAIKRRGSRRPLHRRRGEASGGNRAQNIFSLAGSQQDLHVSSTGFPQPANLLTRPGEYWRPARRRR